MPTTVVIKPMLQTKKEEPYYDKNPTKFNNPFPDERIESDLLRLQGAHFGVLWPVDLDVSYVGLVNTSLDGSRIGWKPVFVKARFLKTTKITSLTEKHIFEKVQGDHRMSTFRLKDMTQQSHVF